MSQIPLIASRSNPQVKRWRELATIPKIRRDEGLVWVEGEHLLVEAQTAGWQVDTLICLENSPFVEVQARQKVMVSSNVMALISQLESPSKVVALLTIPALLPLNLIDHDAVVIDGVQDPGNIGTLLRCAWAFGVSSVILTAGSASAWSMKALRAGQGAQFWMNIEEGVASQNIMKRLRVPLMATSLQKDAIDLDKLDLRNPVAWALGHEGQGLSPQLLDLADHRVCIPMPGQAQSLNVAAAGAVCLYETMRQRR
ncbi:MAG: RNA methyltransferase [Burkholderiaceae bacterium]|nr:RNA methyltransferase [Burkholderiaceae bacterium]